MASIKKWSKDVTLKIGIDVGGTFTDFLVVDGDAEPQIHKTLSTPEDPATYAAVGQSHSVKKVSGVRARAAAVNRRCAAAVPFSARTPAAIVRIRLFLSGARRFAVC